MTSTTDPRGGRTDTPIPTQLTVAYPSVGVCVVAVRGELDALSAPLLDACIRVQLAAAPRHLILDLQPVRFLGCRGLTCLLGARELAQRTGAQLHLTGLVTRVVARPLDATELLGLFDTYPTLTHALATLIRPNQQSPSRQLGWLVPDCAVG